MAKRSQPLVREHLENISRVALEQHQSVIREYVKGKQGVYALYRGEGLKYVGLASNLRSRLQAHLRDRHAQSWDKFSLYLTMDDEHLRELEALVIRIAAPRENRQKATFSKSENLSKHFKRDIQNFYKKQIQEIFGLEEFEEPNRRPARKKESAGKSPPPKVEKLKELNLGRGGKKWIQIRAEYKGDLYKAIVRSSGLVCFKGKIYSSCSLAAMAITQTTTINGWKFWKYMNSEGQWVYLDHLRKN